MKPLRFVDAGVTLGARYELPIGSERSTVSSIVEAMGECSVAKALVRHAAGRDHEPMQGNAMLLEAISRTDSLVPVAVVTPLSFLGAEGRVDDAGAVRDYFARHRFRGATIYPSSANHNFPVSDWCFGVILSALEAMRVPLFVALGEAGGDALASLLASHPSLPVIAGNILYGFDRVLFPLLDRYANLYLESSMDRQYLGLEEYSRRFGAERIVFGSCYPASSIGASVAAVIMSSLSDREKRLIASENIDRLTEGIDYAS